MIDWLPRDDDPCHYPRVSRRPDLLFLCVANSARSQIAEGWGRRMAPTGVRVYSAGSEPGTLHPAAVEAMAEVGIDIRSHVAKPLDRVPLDGVGRVITLCAEELCPIVAEDVERLHWPLSDPAAGSLQEAELDRFRETRDELERRLRAFFAGP